jgi:hypothetical protein
MTRIIALSVIPIAAYIMTSMLALYIVAPVVAYTMTRIIALYIARIV